MFMVLGAADTLHIAGGNFAYQDRIVAKTHTRSATQQGIQARQRHWLQLIVKTTGETLTTIATRSGVSDTTLTRLVNNSSYKGTLSQVTIDRIVEAYKVPGPEEARRPLTVGFSEAERFDPAEDHDGIGPVVTGMIGKRSGIEAWRLRTEAIDAAGYLPGDVLIVDRNATPVLGDIVCAIAHDWRAGGHATVWRVFDPPYLVAASSQRASYKPMLVDNDRVVVTGVVERMVRPHRLSATR